MKKLSFVPAALAAALLVAGPAAAETTIIEKRHGMHGTKIVIKKHHRHTGEMHRKVVIKRHVD